MSKEIHILLTKEQFEELEDLRAELNFILGIKRKTYEEYLEEEKKNPSMALFG